MILRLSQMAVEQLKKAGFTEEQIGVATRDQQRSEAEDQRPERVAGTHVEEVPSRVPSLLGRRWVLLALGVAAGVLPGIGRRVAGGVLGSLAVTRRHGRGCRRCCCGLMSLGLTEQEAKHYEKELAGRPYHPRGTQSGSLR